MNNAAEIQLNRILLSFLIVLGINMTFTAGLVISDMRDRQQEKIEIEQAFFEEVNKELDRRFKGHIWCGLHYTLNGKKAIMAYGPQNFPPQETE